MSRFYEKAYFTYTITAAVIESCNYFNKSSKRISANVERIEKFLNTIRTNSITIIMGNDVHLCEKPNPGPILLQ